MCTVIAFDRVCEEYPLIVVGVRDESYVREASEPVILEQTPRVVAPVDLRCGGTWFGVRSDGMFVALTNQEDGRHREDAPSRGVLVRDILRNGVAWTEIVKDPHAYNAYNLLHGCPGDLYRTTVIDGSVNMSQLLPGVHVVCNDEVNGTFDAKKRRLLSLAGFLSVRERSPRAIMQFLRSMLSDHELATAEDPYLATCVHTPDYGTRSLTVAFFRHEGTPLLYHAEGPICEDRPFRDFSYLL